MDNKVIDELQDLLFKITSLSELTDNRRYAFFTEVKSWIKSVEQLFIQNRIIAGSQISTYYCLLSSVAQDGLIPEGLVFQKNPTQSKLKHGAAAFYLQKTVDIIYSYLLQISASIEESNRRNNTKSS